MVAGTVQGARSSCSYRFDAGKVVRIMDQGNFSQPPLETTQSEKLVSVVVPSYNHALFVESTLRSIFRQTLAPAQLLVIDDGSTDDSPYIIERVLRDCPFE